MFENLIYVLTFIIEGLSAASYFLFITWTGLSKKKGAFIPLFAHVGYLGAAAVWTTLSVREIAAVLIIVSIFCVKNVAFCIAEYLYLQEKEEKRHHLSGRDAVDMV